MPNSKILKSIYWIIDIPENIDYSSNLKNVFTPLFNVEFNDVTSQWRLYYNLNYESTNEFCVFLECCSEPDVVGFDCKFRSSIMNSSFSDSLNILKNKWNRTDGASGYYKNWKTGSNCFKREGGELMGNSLGMCLMSSFGLMDKKDQLYPDGKLHMKFTIYEINIFASALATSEKSSFNYVIESDKVFDIMTSSLNSDEVVIKANDGVIVKAFKSLLCEKSTVFRDLITKDLSESAGITVDIIEFNGQVIQELLRFIYFGNVHNIKQVDMELLRAAKFYDIPGLQKMCMESLVEKIHDDDLIHVVKFSDIYDLDELFEHCCKKLECMHYRNDIKNKFKMFELKLQSRILQEILTVKMKRHEIFFCD